MSDDPDGTWPDNLITFSDDGWPEMGFSGEPFFERYILEARLRSLSALKIFLLVLCATFPLALLYQASLSGRSEFETGILIELSSGAVMFAILPAVLALSLVRPGFTLALILVLFSSCAAGAYFSSGIPRSLFIEACGGFLTFLLLEVVWRSLMGDVEVAIQKAWEDRSRFEQEWDK